MLWSVVAVAVGGWLLWRRDYRRSRLRFAAWARETGEVVAAGALAFGWLWLLVRWVAR